MKDIEVKMRSIKQSEYRAQLWEDRYGADPEITIKDMISELIAYLPERDYEFFQWHTEENLQEALENIFLDGMAIPGGRILKYFASPKGKNLTPMNCFVEAIKEDSMEGIFACDKNIGETFKWGGGQGTDISGLRPRHSKVNNAAKTSTGAASFVAKFNNTAQIVGQGGRRAALKCDINCQHPDVEEFIELKISGGLTYTNISVKITDEFMKAVDEDSSWDLWFPEETLEPVEDKAKTVEFIADCYNFPQEDFFYIKSDQTFREKVIWKSVKAKTVFQKIAWAAWNTGDPGILFWDRILEDNPHAHSTNPCLGKYTKLWDGDSFRYICDGGKTFISWYVGKKDTIMLNLSDDRFIILTPEHKIMKADGSWIQAKDSLGEKLINPADLGFTDSSIPKGEVWVIKIVNWGKTEVWDYRMKKPPHYNFCGGLIAANCGEEPLPAGCPCALAHINSKKHKSSEQIERTTRLLYVFLNALLIYCVEKRLFPTEEQRLAADYYKPIGIGILGVADYFIDHRAVYGDSRSIFLIENFMKTKSTAEKELNAAYGKLYGQTKRNCQTSTIAPTGTISLILNVSSGLEPIYELEYYNLIGDERVKFTHPVPKDKKQYAITAHNVPAEKRLAVQSTAQKYVDGSISSTINLGKTAKVSDIEYIFYLAFQNNLKGLTVFRDGSKEGALSKSFSRENVGRNAILDGKTVKVPFDRGWYVTVNFYNDKPVEVFINAGKTGSELTAWTEAIGRLASLYLQKDGDVGDVLHTLEGIRGGETNFKNGWVTHSGPDAVGKAIAVILADQKTIEIKKDVCENCKEEAYAKIGSCGVCHNCGYSKCE